MEQVIPVRARTPAFGEQPVTRWSTNAWPMPPKRRFSRLAELTDEVSHQLVRTGIPRSADLTPEHHELLRAAVQFRVGDSLSALGDPQGGSIVCSSTGLQGTCA